MLVFPPSDEHCCSNICTGFFLLEIYTAGIWLSRPIWCTVNLFSATTFVVTHLTVENTRCDNLIPGMALWKKNLLTCALSAAVALKYSPCESMHFVRRWCHCRKQSWKSFPGIPRSNVVTLRWMSGISENLFPFRAIFNFGKSQKLQGLSQLNKVDGPFL
jgi:hypothetical protein